MSEIPDEWWWELHAIFLEDNPEKLKDFFDSNEIYPRVSTEVIITCIKYRAKKCFFFLLSDDGFGIKGRFPYEVFSSALSMDLCEPEIVDCILRKFGGIEFANTHVVDRVPLRYIPHKLCDIYPLSTWTHGESLVKLLILLFDPQMKKSLNCLRLLAYYTYSRVDVAIAFVSSGFDVELAALLLAAARDLLPLLKLQLSKSLLSSVKDMNGVSSQAILGKHIYLSGFGLIDIFDKAGDSLKEFYNSMPEDISSEDLIKGVAKILIKDAKISISEEDVDVAGILSVEPEMMPSIHKYLGIKPKDRIDESQRPMEPQMMPSIHKYLGTKPKDRIDESQRPMFPTVNSSHYLYLLEREISGARLSDANSNDQIKRFINARSRLRMGRHLYSTMTFQSPRISPNSQAWFTVAPTSTLRGMLSLAMRLKRNIRFL